MGDTLKAGGLGSAAAGGTPPEFAASMAQAMEQALNELLIAEGRDTMSTENTTETRDRRILFVAIARGIVRHLSTNHDAFDVVRDDDGSKLAQHRITIKTKDQ
jgi:hypothetical protein